MTMAVDVEKMACQECGATCGLEYHPYLYCELVKLGHTDPAGYLASYGFTGDEQKRNALHVARDFIAHHPAVQGEWPLVLDVIDSALGGDDGDR